MRLLAILVPLGTAAIAFYGIYRTAQTAADDRQADRDAKAAEGDAAERKRFDERFAAAAVSVASEKLAERRAGAVLVASLVRENTAQGAGELSEQAVNLLLTLLQKPAASADEHTRALLVHALERALRAYDRDGLAIAERFSLTQLDVTDIKLGGIGLSGVDLAHTTGTGSDLRGTDLAGSRSYELILEGADLSDAVLTGCQWRRLLAHRSTWHRAHLTGGARLRRANLERADFFAADLRGADLEYATLVGAKLQQTELAGAKFRNATLDDAALRTVVQSAKQWREAEWDDAHRARLEVLAGD